MIPLLDNLLIHSAITGFIIINAMLGCVTYLVWTERKVAGHIQLRIGPERVGPFGLLQTIADVLKLFLKEDITPSSADKVLYTLAPMLAVIPPMAAFAVVPVWSQFAQADVNVGILWVFAFTSLSVYAIVLAGWSSKSKYSTLGGLRASAQMISYELPMGLSILSIVMWSGTLSLKQIVLQQAHCWNILVLPFGPLAFLLFLICAIAETNRAPFDLPEAEAELVAGFATEYSSMKWSFFFLGEYAAMITACSVAASLFLGGWGGPMADKIPLLGALYLAIKVFALIFVFMWIRWTFPRFRYDQLMSFGWKFLLPASLGVVVLAAVFMTLFPGFYHQWYGR